MHKRPSAATVLALVALFVSLGGTAIASVIITSNRQVSAHVISGAAGPSNDNKNLIPGSIGSTDLHAGAVAGIQLANRSVSPAKLNLPKIALSVKDTDPSSTVSHHTALSLHGVTVGLSCTNDGSGGVRMDVFLNAPSGEFRGTFEGGSAGTFSEPGIVVQAPNPGSWYEADSDTPLYLEAHLVYHNSQRVITLDLDASIQVGGCDMYGTAVPAPN